MLAGVGVVSFAVIGVLLATGSRAPSSIPGEVTEADRGKVIALSKGETRAERVAVPADLAAALEGIDQHRPAAGVEPQEDASRERDGRRTEPGPAVLSPHGHWEGGRFSERTDEEARALVESGDERLGHVNAAERAEITARVGGGGRI